MKIFSAVILSLPLIQEGQLCVFMFVPTGMLIMQCVTLKPTGNSVNCPLDPSFIKLF